MSSGFDVTHKYVVKIASFKPIMSQNKSKNKNAASFFQPFVMVRQILPFFHDAQLKETIFLPTTTKYTD